MVDHSCSVCLAQCQVNNKQAEAISPLACQFQGRTLQLLLNCCEYTYNKTPPNLYYYKFYTLCPISSSNYGITNCFACII